MGQNVCFNTDLLSRNISASGFLPEISPKVCLRRVQTGPEMCMASLAQRIAEEEVSSDSLCLGDDQQCHCCFAKGGKSLIECGSFDVLISARCKMDFDRCGT